GSGRGGNIEVRSARGRGTPFGATLPVRTLPPPPAEVRGPLPEPVEPDRRPRILLIDDEAHLGVTLSVGLRDQADVISVRSGGEAVRTLLADDRFDLILCDLMMPDLTG